MPRARLSKRRLLGFDRSGPPPPQTAADAAWHPWTVPNAIGYGRIALIPVFLVLDSDSRHGTAGAAVCWSYELLPRWALAVLLVRELLMLFAGQAWLRRGFALAINWPGRIAVAPTMLGIWLGLLGVRSVGEVFLYVGLSLAWIATAVYFRDGLAQTSVSSST